MVINMVESRNFPFGSPPYVSNWWFSQPRALLGIPWIPAKGQKPIANHQASLSESGRTLRGRISNIGLDYSLPFYQMRAWT